MQMVTVRHCPAAVADGQVIREKPQSKFINQNHNKYFKNYSLMFSIKMSSIFISTEITRVFRRTASHKFSAYFNSF